MDNKESYHLPVQTCPRCGLSACIGLMCVDCRYRKHDTQIPIKYDHCYNLSADHGNLCKCTPKQLERFYRLREADLERLAHQIRTIIKLKTGEIHG